MEIALKIDVDTHRGLGEGVPRLKRVLSELEVAASFFIAMGPDNSGRAIVRMFRNPGFIAKMRRTRATSMYGLRTILSGTILPSRPIALAYPHIIRDLARSGFEVGVHGYDHVRWQDRLDLLSENELRSEIDEAFEVGRAILGEAPRNFAAPGWRTRDTGSEILEGRGLAYRSDTRGRSPYRVRINERILVTPEIPTTLPTLDEILATPELDAAGSLSDFYLARMREDTINVHTIHAETEGMSQLGNFTGLIQALKKKGASFVRLDKIASGLTANKLPVCEIVRMTLPGRAGWISAQGPAS
jgi:undecaprenyl phosphate-alpha-L-ara4FN deformylase